MPIHNVAFTHCFFEYEFFALDRQQWYKWALSRVFVGKLAPAIWSAPMNEDIMSRNAQTSVPLWAIVFVWRGIMCLWLFYAFRHAVSGRSKTNEEKLCNFLEKSKLKNQTVRSIVVPR